MKWLDRWGEGLTSAHMLSLPLDQRDIQRKGQCGSTHSQLSHSTDRPLTCWVDSDHPIPAGVLDPSALPVGCVWKTAAQRVRLVAETLSSPFAWTSQAPLFASTRPFASIEAHLFDPSLRYAQLITSAFASQEANLSDPSLLSYRSSPFSESHRFVSRLIP